MKNKAAFEQGVIKYLTHNDVPIWHEGEFFHLCCKLKGFDENTVNRRVRVQHALADMVKKRLIVSHRKGTGPEGLPLYGFKSVNTYSLRKVDTEDNPIEALAAVRPVTLELFYAHARHPQTPIAEVEARLLDVCRKERDMDMYPILRAALREIYRIEGAKKRK